MPRRWQPIGEPYWNRADPPEPGSLIANRRVLWRVLAIHERHPENWDDNDRRRMDVALKARDRLRLPPKRGEVRGEYHERLAAWDGRPETWPNRPRAVEVRPADGGKRVHYPWPHAGWVNWYPLDEHHAVCASCGELYPCRERDAAREAGYQMRQVEKLMAEKLGRA